ncbi:MAG TPA: ABC transporter ATP-binding protein, partial [Solirubrobacteraceae bacterium]
MTDTAIHVSALRRAYGDFVAVHDVSFSVARGEVFCLLGPNGAGKTTTTEILEGYRDRTGGDVRVLGHDPAGQPRALRERIGVVLQETGIQPELSVSELLRMYGSWYPRRRAAGELLELTGLTEKRDTPANELSGGQRRRLDLALALVGRPELVFLDEPTTGFDPEARRLAWETIRGLAQDGTTIVLTTHFMDEAQALADRVAVLARGRIVAEGTPDELRARVAVPAKVRYTLHGEQVVVSTADAAATAHEITTWARAHGHTLHGFAVEQPTLEDAYLELIR